MVVGRTADDSTAENAILVDARAVSIGYASRDRVDMAVHDVDLTISIGESVALIGESGSGKTTLARAIIGLLPNGAIATSGSVAFRTSSGERLDLLRDSQDRIRSARWKDLAYVPQASASSFNPLITIEEHFLETARAHGLSEREARDKADGLLRTVRLEPVRILRSYPHELSGGSAQRAFIALSLLLDPSLLVLDEPTTGLDVITQRSVVETLKDLQARVSTAFVFVTHDLRLATEIGERVLTMYAGRIVETWHPMVQPVPSHPYTRALLEALPQPGQTEAANAIRGVPVSARDVPPGCAFHPRCGLAFDMCALGEPPVLRPADRGMVACHLYGTEQ